MNIKIAVISVTTLIFLSICEAEPDSVTIGSYNISFDLNQPYDAYNLTMDGPIESEWLSGDYERLHIFKLESNMVDGYCIAFMIKEFTKIDGASSNNLEKFLKSSYPDADAISSRDVDGKHAAIAKVQKLDQTEYVVVYYPFPNSLAIFISCYPWDKGTLSFLKTIQIKKAM